MDMPLLAATMDMPLLAAAIAVLTVCIFTYRAIKHKLLILYFNIRQHLLKRHVLFGVDMFDKLSYVGGVDISFVKDDAVTACISLKVLDITTLEEVCSVARMIKMDVEYIPGYLAFRETPHIKLALQDIKKSYARFYPDVLMVDGNGRLHRKQFGLACQTGVVCDIPCIGVAKNLYQMEGVLKHDRSAMSEGVEERGDYFNIEDISGVVIGCAVKSTAASTKPIFVSEGHKVSLETARDVVLKCCRYRVPEPIRLADIGSREILRGDN